MTVGLAPVNCGGAPSVPGRNSTPQFLRILACSIAAMSPLARATRTSLLSPERINDLGTVTMPAIELLEFCSSYASPADLAAYTGEQYELWGKAIKAAGIEQQ